MTALRVSAALTLLAAALHAAPAAAAGAAFVAAPATLPVRCGAGVANLAVTWYFPTRQPAVGTAWMQHGFFRANVNAADMASKLASTGMVVVAPTIPSFGGCDFNDLAFLGNLAEVFADPDAPDSALVASGRAAARTLGLTLPALPGRLLFAGHSAGGAAVTYAAGHLVTRVPSAAARLRGLILLDPVENLARALSTGLAALADVPILAVTAPASSCNANRSGATLLAGLGRPFIGIEVTGGSHCDGEGASGNPVLCGLVCGTVNPVNVVILQFFALNWGVDLLLGRTTGSIYPGGAIFEWAAGAGLIRGF
jgi:dienelactone hydrolase